MIIKVVEATVVQQLPSGVVDELRIMKYKCIKLPQVVKSHVDAIMELGDALFESESHIKETMTVKEDGDSNSGVVGRGHLARGDLGYRTTRGDQFLDTRMTEEGDVVPLSHVTESALPGLKQVRLAPSSSRVRVRV